MLKILGVGYPRTGTSTLCEALRILGYNAIHHAPSRVSLYPPDRNESDNYAWWRRYDDIDAVTDAPAAMYWRELTIAYPGAKCILTVRDDGSWWESIKRHTNTIRTGNDLSHIRYTDALHTLLFSCPEPSLYWWLRRYRERNEMIRREIPREKLLVLDIVGGDKWEPLCEFLGKPIPGAPWPWENRSDPPRTKPRRSL